MKNFHLLISIFVVVWSGALSTKAQTYSVSGPTLGQGPLLNRETTVDNSGWNSIHLYNAGGNASVNSWSSAQGIGFPFSFYDNPVTHFCVSKNFLLTFNTTVAGTTVNSHITTDNTTLPNSNLPDSTIAYFWGSFGNPPPIGGDDNIWRKTFGTAPNRQLWIKNFSYECEAQSWSYNFVVLEETTHKIYVADAQWANQAVGSYTVGVQLDSTTAVQHLNSPNIKSINGSASNPWPNVSYYEFTPRPLVNDDAGILSLDNPISLVAPGSQSVQVSIKNHGLNSLASIMVGWSVDGIAQTSYNWMGSLALGAVDAIVNIGSYNFTLGNPTLKIWTSNPNGNPDNDTSNDTLEISLVVCNLLSGTYTLGRTSSDFPNFDSLATLLNNCGVSGAVTISIAPGTYREQFTLGNIAGVSQSNTIVIDGGTASLVTLTHDDSTSNATVAFDGVSYVSLRNMTLENTDSTRSNWVVHLQNTDYIVIDSCLIEQLVNTTSDRGGIVGSGSLSSSFTATTNNHLTVSDNTITGGYYGISLVGNESDEDVGNHILRNRFSDIELIGIRVDEQDSLIISGNVIENTNSSVAYDIYCQDITDFEITANNLLDCGDEGIVIYEGVSSGTSRSLIANNMIYAPTNAAIRVTSIFGSVSDVNIYHNTAVGNPAMMFYGVSFSNMSLYNNIFSNPSGAALDIFFSLPSTIDIDYNLYQASGNIVVEGSTTYSNLAAWQTAKPALNAHSVEGDPVFVRETAPVDLHVLDSLANDTGKSALGIHVDIDDDPRPLPPSARVDIGADEYHPATCLSPTGLSTPAIGQTTAQLSWITGGASNWNIEYGLQGFTPGMGTFRHNVSNPYALSGLTPGTDYDFYTQDSCGVGDVSFWSDPLHFSTPCVDALRGTYTLGRAVGPNNFPNFDSLATMLNSCGIKGPVIISIAPGTYREQFTLGNIAGASQSNTIVIDGGDSSLVTLTHDGSTSNATVAFDSISYVSLRNMTLEATKSSSDAWVVHLRNTDYVVIDSCLIEQPVNTASDRGGIVGSGSLDNSSTATTNKHLTVSHNTIIGGFYGISLVGNKSDEDVGNHILRNRFSGIEQAAIEVDEQDSLIISGNVIENTNSSVSYDIHCQDITDFEITANNLFDCGDEGIVISGGGSSGTTRSLIANNMIYAPDAAIRISSGYNFFLSSVNIYHNTAVGNPAMEFTGSTHSNMNLYNNIFSNPSGAALVALSVLPSTIDIDYNLYQASGNIAVENFTNYANLAAWQTAKPILNQNSVEGNPLFVKITAPADLHVTGTLANDTGKDALDIHADIDGDPRPLLPSTKVDIGADEYHPATCLSSPGLSTSAIGQTTAQLNWITGGASNWNIEYGLQGFTLGSGTFVYNVPNPYILTGLNPITNYDFYVQDSCGIGDVSLWRGPVSFFTLCPSLSPATLPIVEDFESASGISQRSRDVLCYPTHKWSYETSLVNEGRLRFAVTGFANNGNSAATLDNSSPSPLEAINYLILTADLSNYTTSSALELEFNYMHHGEEDHANDRVWIRDSDTNSWVKIYDLSANKGTEGIYNQVIGLDIDFILANATPPQRVSSTFQVRFGQEDNANATSRIEFDGYSFDDIAIRETCPTPTNLIATNITQNSATLSWVAGGASNWNLEWDTAGRALGSGNFLPNVAPTPYALSGLIPGTSYQFYVRDSCRLGYLSSWAGPYTFNTLSRCPAPSSLGASNITQTTAELSWITGGASNWDLEYGIQGFIPGPGTFVYNVSNPYTLSSLTPGTDYDFYVRDSCGTNNLSTWAGPYTFTTLPLPCPSPFALFAIKITQNTAAALAWVSGGISTSNWDLEYGLSGFTLGSGTRISTTTPFYTVSGLTPGQSYQFYVRDSCGVGHVSSWAGPEPFFSVISPCPFPSSLSATQITQTNATLSWVTGGASNWGLEYGLSGFTLGSGIRISTTTTSYAVSGLTPGRSYQFYVRDSCRGRVSVWAGPHTFRTLGCLAPTGLNLHTITEITATVSWTSGGASNWNIEYGPINFPPLGSGIFLYNVSSPRILRGLKPNTFYDVYVQDSCNVGNVSNWAGPLSIKTIIGIDELLERSFRIYPNPSEGVFKLEFSSSLGEDMEIRITNMMGQIVLEDEIESFSGSYRKRLEMGAYRSGVYLLQLITERATVNRRIILQ